MLLVNLVERDDVRRFSGNSLRGLPRALFRRGGSSSSESSSCEMELSSEDGAEALSLPLSAMLTFWAAPRRG